MPSTPEEWDQWEHKTAQVQDDIELHYVDVGPMNAASLVLVHGWPDLWFGWRHQIGPLAKKYRVIALDLRGFGRSSKPKEVTKYGAKNITSDLARLLDILEIPQAVFIGHDWGGSIVWRMCLYQPDRVLAVAGICTPYLPPTQELVDLDELVKRAPQFEYMKFLAQSETAAKLLDSVPRRFFTIIFRQHHERAGGVSVVDLIKNVATSDHPVYTAKSDLLTDDELDFYEREYQQSGFQACCNYYATRALDLENERGLSMFIKHKALYIGARNDPVLKPEMAAHMPQLMPNLSMKVIEEAGHWVLWEQPDQVSDTLLEWLANVVEVVP